MICFASFCFNFKVIARGYLGLAAAVFWAINNKLTQSFLVHNSAHKAPLAISRKPLHRKRENNKKASAFLKHTETPGLFLCD